MLLHAGSGYVGLLEGKIRAVHSLFSTHVDQVQNGDRSLVSVPVSSGLDESTGKRHSDELDAQSIRLVL